MGQTMTVKMRQVVDWGAAIWAGLISGVLFLIIAAVLGSLFLGSASLILRLMAAIVLGSSAVLDPPTVVTYLVGLLVHLPLAIGFTAIVAFVIHRWGLLVGIVGGAVLGLALYLINFYALSALFPWFSGFRNWVMLVSHVAFGALAGGIYELLEVEEFVPVEQD